MEARDASWIEDPEVPRLVRLAVRRKIRMFDEFHDLDRDSLFRDCMGELVKAKYDRTKSKPGTFAYRVAWARLIDIGRRRSKEREKQLEGREAGEVRRDAVEEGKTPEEAAADLYELAKSILKQKGIPLNRQGPGRPTLNRAQQLALVMLQQRMGWSCRESEAALSEHPGILVALGVTQSRSYRFFCRINGTVTKFKDFCIAPPAAA